METALEIKGDVPIVGPSGEEKLNQELLALDIEEKEKKAKILAFQTRQENSKAYATHLREYNYQIKRVIAKKYNIEPETLDRLEESKRKKLEEKTLVDVKRQAKKHRFWKIARRSLWIFSLLGFSYFGIAMSALFFLALLLDLLFGFLITADMNLDHNNASELLKHRQYLIDHKNDAVEEVVENG